MDPPTSDVVGDGLDFKDQARTVLAVPASATAAIRAAPATPIETPPVMVSATPTASLIDDSTTQALRQQNELLRERIALQERLTEQQARQMQQQEAMAGRSTTDILSHTSAARGEASTFPPEAITAGATMSIQNVPKDPSPSQKKVSRSTLVLLLVVIAAVAALVFGLVFGLRNRGFVSCDGFSAPRTTTRIDDDVNNDSSITFPPSNGNLPTCIASLTALTYLSLSTLDLQGTLPAAWSASLTALTHLELDDHQLTGTLPAEWGRFSLLDNLSLRDNLLTGSIPDEWEQLSSALERLDLRNNALTGNLPSWVSQQVANPSVSGNDFVDGDTNNNNRGTGGGGGGGGRLM